ncbi:MAG: glutamate--tRNA ligase [Candidatus Ancillula trichonymphae]|nr:glutamate--tRNA ligase [Candidatus Ancillula trichonymphae]
MSESVRVRFCPSPTGTPHVGLIRTCLFNWAYARHADGSFVFRIEDTDQERDSEDSYKMIVQALKWLGLDWNEGVEIGGPHAPYRQSQRLDIYKTVVEKLLESGFAYKSFSTPEEIQARNEAAGRPKQMGYDGFDRNLTPAQIEEFEASGRKPSIRLRMPNDDITFTDLVRGTVTFKAGSIPDFVVVRANGQPLYTLVNPVDDALMEINYILRGEDLLSSTSRQIALYNALLELGIAKTMPKFGHLPYVMGEGNKKLSKRDPESNLFLHRENGMIPEGLLNYLALLGWSIAPDRDVFTVDELIKEFEPGSVLANPAKFDAKKCTAINAEHIRRLDADDFKRRVVPYLYGNISEPLLELNLIKQLQSSDPEMPHLTVHKPLTSSDEYDELTDHERRVLDLGAPLIQERIQLLGQAREMLGFLLVDSDALEYEDNALDQVKKISGAREVVQKALELLETVQQDAFTAANLHDKLNQLLVVECALKPRVAFMPLRVAISGRRVSPPLFESVEILGKLQVVVRLKKFISAQV